MSTEALRVTMKRVELDDLVRNYLQTKFGSSLDYFMIEGCMSPDSMGDMGVTGTYRKRAGDKNTFFTLTVNVPSGKLQNLQEYT